MLVSFRTQSLLARESRATFRVFRVLVNGLPALVCSLLQGHQKIYISGCSDFFREISLFTGETDQ